VKKPLAKGTTENKKSVTDRDKRKYIDFKIKVKKGDPLPSFREDNIRLNKYLSNAGVCSRREADVLIQTGVVSVNGKIVTELGYKIQPDDVVQYDGETINAEKKRYVLLNKPKGFITTMDDPRGRKTVMTLVSKACRERIYPVGRLDRETTGLLLFTNDGDMAKKLTHPRYQARKLYHVELHKPVSREDLEKLLKGVDLEDGKTRVDKAEYVEDTSSREIGVELHSGKNRIVRRLFEALGYNVIKLDRVQFSGLTKKDLPRGMFRHLTEQEVAFLKMTK
jgi:23S rRNA pseudouridine2605 synthase